MKQGLYRRKMHLVGLLKQRPDLCDRGRLQELLGRELTHLERQAVVIALQGRERPNALARSHAKRQGSIIQQGRVKGARLPKMGGIDPQRAHKAPSAGTVTLSERHGALPKQRAAFADTRVTLHRDRTPKGTVTTRQNDPHVTRMPTQLESEGRS